MKRRIDKKCRVSNCNFKKADSKLFEIESDENFAFIAGYTSNGVAYGLTHEEYNSIDLKNSNFETDNFDFMIEDIIIDKLTESNWTDVARIYESGIATKNATFQTCAPTWDDWDKSHRQDCRLIAKIDNKVVGWASLSNVSSRCVYSGVAEVSIYVDSDYRGNGVGDRLMTSLIIDSEKNNIWTLQAGIFPENIGSLKLHHKHGFRTIGIKERIGKMDDKWRDVAIVERRSKIVGID